MRLDAKWLAGFRRASLAFCSQPSQPAVAVSVATARPGEDVDDFQTRIASRGDWGQTRYGREKVELVLTPESVERLAGMLRPELDRQR